MIRIMHIWTRLYIFIKCDLVGSDAFGNRYYEQKKNKKIKTRRRFVLYKGTAEASKIPAGWHGWLSHSILHKPEGTSTLHIPNLTGTRLAFAFHRPLSQARRLTLPQIKHSTHTVDGHSTHTVDKCPPHKDYVEWKPL